MISEEEIIHRSDDLLRRSMLTPGGAISPSIYETGRIAVLAPWLPFRLERVEFLLASQNQDGSWGGPDGYGLVPTLSAADALLAAAMDSEIPGLVSAGLIDAVDRGLNYLDDKLRDSTRCDFADMIASELIIPALIRQLNARLILCREQIKGLSKWHNRRFAIPAGADPGLVGPVARRAHRRRHGGGGAGCARLRDSDAAGPVSQPVSTRPPAPAGAPAGRRSGRRGG